MTRDRWEEIREMIRKQYEVEYEGVEELEGEPGSAEVIEFVGPASVMRLEYVTQPKQTGRRPHGVTRSGSMHNQEIMYSTTETMEHLKAFQWNEEDERWIEMDSKKIAV